MNDTADVVETSCCMRKNPTSREQLYDGINVNVALAAVYFAAYAAGFNFLCIGSFISILLNSVHIVAIFNSNCNKVENNLDCSLDESMDSSDSDKANDLDSESLSLKQRDHGASVAKAMQEEDEIILNSRFQQVVEDTLKRNEERLNKISRTPTNSSLNDEDEYADMPALISLDYSQYTDTTRRCPACIHHYNNLIPINPLNNTPTLNPYIPTVREITTPSRTTALHGMDDVD